MLDSIQSTCLSSICRRVAVLVIVCHAAVSCRQQSGPALPSPDAILVSAQILSASPIPDPKTSDYVDCLFTAEVKIVELRSKHRVPRELVLALPAFTKRKLNPEAAFKEGQIIEAAIMPSEKVGQRLKEMQRSDNLTRFDLKVFYTTTAKLSDKKPEDFAALPNSAFESESNAAAPDKPTAPVRYPWSPKAATERQAAMAESKAAILKAYTENGSDWDQWYHKLDDFYDDLDAQLKASPKGELLKDQFYCNRIVRRKYINLCELNEAGEPGPLKMLSSLNKQLRARGIDLIVVPFPAKEDVHAEIFSSKAPADGWFQPYRQKFLLQLLEADIEVVDLIQPLRAARNRFPYVFYDEEDQHPADGAIQVAAEEIARRLTRYDLLDGAPSLKLTLKPAEVDKPNDGRTRKYPATQVLTSDGQSLEIPEHSSSPVVIMGDSYTRIPHRYLPGGDGCALPMHLAHRLGMLPDQLIRMGGSAQAMHMLAREGGDYLARRRVLVFVFAHNRLFGTAAKNVEYKGDDWNMIEFPPLRLEK